MTGVDAMREQARPITAKLFRRRRAGMQLIEMVASLAISAILLTGVASSVYLSQRSVAKAGDQLRLRNRTEFGLQRLQQDLAEAKQVTARTSTSVSLLVPDRNGDGNADSIYYRWNASLGPLERSTDNTTWTPLTDNIQDLSLKWRTATPPVVEPSPILDSIPGLVFRGRTFASATSNTATLIVASPPACLTGDLFIGAVTVTGNTNLNTPAGWTKIYENSTPSVTTGIYTCTNLTGNTVFTWKDVGVAVGTVIHFSGNSAISPFVLSADNKGSGVITAPAISGTFDKHQIVRILGGVGKGTVTEAPRVSSHSTILLRQVAIPSSSSYLTLAVVTRPVPSSSVSTAVFNFSPSPTSACCITAIFKP
ncbi:MAG: hypothetical protein U0892_15425 [Pirellulales bacterium]